MLIQSSKDPSVSTLVVACDECAWAIDHLTVARAHFGLLNPVTMIKDIREDEQKGWKTVATSRVGEALMRLAKLQDKLA